MNKHHVVSTHDLSAHVVTLVETVNHRDEPVFVAENGDIRAALLGIDTYNALMDRLEDLVDSLSILEARASGEPTRSLDDYLRDRTAIQDTRVSG